MQMALCGLGAGLSWEDLRHMKYTHLMLLLYEWEDMHDVDVVETRQATDEDLAWLDSL